tara:strand:- start:712 stop:1371 length:660 start_codon:yes stop_codon:yes gene_type:complete
MSLAENPPPPLGPDWKPWGERLASFLARTKSKLAYYIAGESASEDGVILWDRTGYPVISKNGVYRQIVLADGYGNFSATSDIVASQADTAYAIAFTTAVANGGISLNASDSTRIDFVEAGVYSISGHLQLKSTSASAKTLYWWLAINGVNINHGERQNLNTNNGYHVLGVSDQLNLSAGDYIQVMWATSHVDLFLDAAAATSFAPASEAINISITRSRQ